MNPVSPTDLLRLREWLSLRELQLALEEPDPPEGWDEPAGISGQPGPVSGQIRLWPAADPSDPPFYALLLPAGYAEWTALPFSSLSLPATPQEFSFRPEGPTAVLQGWNRRRISDALAGASWPADQADAGELFCLQAWCTSLESGGPPPPRIAAACGPPLVHPLDPRHEFLASEHDRVSRCLGEDGVLRVSEPAAHAAEEVAPYAVAVWHIGETGDRLLADPTGLRIDSSLGDVAWEGALLRAPGLSLRWQGRPMPFPDANQVAWASLDHHGHSFALLRSGGGLS